MRSEEERFGVVLTEGLPRLEDVLEQAARGDRVVPGEQAFKLYDTYGLPRDFIEDLASAQGLTFDVEGFERAMQGQREKARAKSAFDGRKAEEFAFASDAERQALSQTADQFEGYATTTVADVPVLALFDEQKRQVDELAAGEQWLRRAGAHAVLSRVGRPGVGSGAPDERAATDARVTGVVRLGAGLPRAHQIESLTGPDPQGRSRARRRRRHAARRDAAQSHRHAPAACALRQVLGGTSSRPARSWRPTACASTSCTSRRSRADELARIERMVNEHIVANSPVETAVRNTQDAIAAGAMALFGEKYGDSVRVVTVPLAGSRTARRSASSCAAARTSARPATSARSSITEESGVAAGVRRIEALTGLGAYEHARQRARSTRRGGADAQHDARRPRRRASPRTWQSESKLRKEVQQLKTKLALGGGGRPARRRRTARRSTASRSSRGAWTIVDKESLRSLADTLKSTLTSGIVFLATPSADGKVSIVATVTPDLIKRAPAGEIVKQLAPIVGGRGGGRPDFAEAGGKDPAKIDDLVNESRSLVERLLAGPSRPIGWSGFTARPSSQTAQFLITCDFYRLWSSSASSRPCPHRHRFTRGAMRRDISSCRTRRVAIGLRGRRPTCRPTPRS